MKDHILELALKHHMKLSQMSCQIKEHFNCNKQFEIINSMETTIAQHEQQVMSESNLSVLKEKLSKQSVAHFFGLPREDIGAFVDTIDFSREGISPMFLSPGYGSNDTDRPRILMTILGNRPDTCLHEARHGLHYEVCSFIFKTPGTSLGGFNLFRENVLGDAEFIEILERSGSQKQREFIHKARELTEKQEISTVDLSGLAVVLGALTYQHAYFVDPRMCEAVASFGDTGITKVVGAVNRSATYFIPNHDTLALKGYGDRESQAMFRAADPYRKALLVRKECYERRYYFNSSR